MIQDQKNSIRKQIKAKKTQFTEEHKLAKAQVIFHQVEQFPEFKNARVVLLYWSMPDEVYTHDFVQKWYQKKCILLPSVNGDFMDLKVYSGEASMKEGERFGIKEPNGEKFTDYEAIDLALIPGIAFDKLNYRMGRGKGYYDRFLSNFKGVKIGVCFDFQIIEKVPLESHDVAMDMIIYG